MAQQKRLVIVRGPSGSGKSHKSKEISEQYGAPVFSTDKFFMVNKTEENPEGEYQFNRDYIGYAHSWNQGLVEEAMQGNVPVVIVDNTNTTLDQMKPYVRMAQQYGYAVDFEEPDISWNPKLKTREGRWNVEELDKIQNRPDRDKIVPRDILQKMVDEYNYNPTEESVLSSERSGRPD